LHAILGTGATPVKDKEYDSLYNNVTYYPYGNTVIHRTSAKFASFSWNTYFLALSFNGNGSWQNWPRESSYIGRINGSEAGRKEAVLEYIYPVMEEDAFAVTGKIRRQATGAELIQDISFTSLEGDITVYIERLTKLRGSVGSRETGLVGHEFELGESQRKLYTKAGIKMASTNGAEPMEIHSSWLNIGGKIGYMVCRNGIENIMTYHYATERNRDCDYITLIGESHSTWTTDWACVVTFLNQDQTGTAGWAGKVDFRVDGNTATCIIGDQAITAVFTPEMDQ
jgi:hypothetical protein